MERCRPQSLDQRRDQGPAATSPGRVVAYPSVKSIALLHWRADRSHDYQLEGIDIEEPALSSH